ncbi:MAG: M3 family metallopeptidase, partial [Burkholderiales bacterium]|nr:M3 family metallopeptidase [Burkholderiales bacterium]
MNTPTPLSSPDMHNPLLSFGRGIAQYDQVKPEQIAPAIEFLLSGCEAAVTKAIDPKTPASWNDLAEPLEDATEQLGRSWGVVSHLNAVADTPELRAAYGAMLPKVTAFFASLGQNLELYKRYKEIKASAEFAKLSPEQQKVIDNSLRDFRLGGAELADDQKPRFTQIQDEQAALAKAFSDHVLDATDSFIHLVSSQADLIGLPEDAIAAAADTAKQKGLEGWAFTLHFPSYYPVQQYSQNRSLRRLLYEAYVTRASELAPQYSKGNIEWDNTHNMIEQLRLRDEEARMLGFDNYAALSLAPKMARDVSEVDSFLTDFAKRAKPFAQKDWNELQEFARSLGLVDGIEPWDMAFISERLKHERYAFSENELKQYFPLPKV